MLMECDRETRITFLSQQAYLPKSLHTFSMDHGKGCSMILDSKSKLHLMTEVEESTKIHTYQEAVGSLTYTAITTRSDIVYAVGLVRGFAANQLTLHWPAVQRILQYIQAKKGYISKKNTLRPSTFCTPSPPDGPGAYNVNSSSGCICPRTCPQGTTTLHRAATGPFRCTNPSNRTPREILFLLTAPNGPGRTTTSLQCR